MWYFPFILSIVQFSFFISVMGNMQDNPGARWGHVLIHDAARDEVLLFGGTSGNGIYLDDTWIWSGDSWKNIQTVSPSSRGFCGVAYHKDRNSIILHGGRGDDGVTYSDTWEWNGREWEQLEESSEFKVDHHQMVYMDREEIILAFGGWNGKDVSGDTWIWSGKWKRVTGPSPPKRAAFAMSYHDRDDKVMLFGGLWINGQYADLWEWSGGQWKAIGGPYDHSSLDHHAMIYDEDLNELIIFGGKNYRYEVQNHTLVVSGSQIDVLTDEGPGKRHSMAFTYDSSNKLGYLYGGKEYVGEEQVAIDDFWKWQGGKWERIDMK